MDKAIGCMLGCAIGDALGMAQEIFPQSANLEEIFEQVRKQRQQRKKPQTDYESGGPWAASGHIMQAGEWTDDTAMMLCLADSILHKQTIDVADLMKRFITWWFSGYNSCTGSSLGLGGNTKNALYRFDPQDPYRIVGGSDPLKDAGNGAIMRLAPVPVYWSDDLDTAILMAKVQSSTTHNVTEATDASALMTFIIWHALNGRSKTEIFDRLHECRPHLDNEHILQLIQPNASWKTMKTPDKLITLPGRSLWSLESALWCVYHTYSFFDAVVTAINLGGDADTVGAITGQIAGALYGFNTIPHHWVTGVHHFENIIARARALYLRQPFDPSTMVIRNET